MKLYQYRENPFNKGVPRVGAIPVRRGKQQWQLPLRQSAVLAYVQAAPSGAALSALKTFVWADAPDTVQGYGTMTFPDPNLDAKADIVSTDWYWDSKVTAPETIFTFNGRLVQLGTVRPKEGAAILEIADDILVDSAATVVALGDKTKAGARGRAGEASGRVDASCRGRYTTPLQQSDTVVTIARDLAVYFLFGRRPGARSRGDGAAPRCRHGAVEGHRRRPRRARMARRHAAVCRRGVVLPLCSPSGPTLRMTDCDLRGFVSSDLTSPALQAPASAQLAAQVKAALAGARLVLPCGDIWSPSASPRRSPSR